ncbi:metallophosphoesterase family protein [Rhizobium sp. SL42]|uniref:metallophosphoesterase family protein n=1 Tax=Rhizobium sp. SL42 TaxID=2806346 RepID=UPI001F2748FB|nr:metallophosphoesterase family protein [Rhizobium sp. SL42]UJW74402.1 metallophosphoesterase family protein [Rhizobium sp. SL42]
MRFAAIADVHGNHLALQAVLDHIAAQGIGDIVNLGDCFSGPLEAGKVATLLLPLGLTTVRGNHDRYLVETPVDAMGKSDAHAFAQLDQSALDWLKTLPFDAVWREDVYLCHAGPDADDRYFIDTVSEAGIFEPRALGEIEVRAAGVEQKLILCGHSHVARLVRLSDDRLIVNPGSVGCPAYQDDVPVPHTVEAGHPRACYAICENIDGVWQVAFQQVDYDHQAMAELALRNGRPEWASGLATGFIR